MTETAYGIVAALPVREHVAVACAVDDGERYCACGAGMDRVECEQCGGEGWTEPGALYEQDPLWYDEEDQEPCHLCLGEAGWWVCYEVLDHRHQGAA